MDFETEIEPLVVRNNNQIQDQTSSLPSDLQTNEVISVSSDDDEKKGDDNLVSVKSVANNNNVIIPITKHSFDIKNCYEFIGLVKQSSDERDKTLDESKGNDVPKQSEIVPSSNITNSSSYSCDKVRQADSNQQTNNKKNEAKIWLKVNLKQKLKQQRIKLRRKQKSEELRRCKEKLRELLPRHLSTCRLDTSTLVGAITKYCHFLQDEVGGVLLSFGSHFSAILF